MFAIAGFLRSPVVHAEPRATATQRAEIELGETSQLNGDRGISTAGALLPAVDGLEFNHVGQSAQLQFVNGQMSGDHLFFKSPHRPLHDSPPSRKIGSKAVETNQLTCVASLLPSIRRPLPPSSAPTPTPCHPAPKSRRPPLSILPSPVDLSKTILCRRIGASDLKVYCAD